MGMALRFTVVRTRPLTNVGVPWAWCCSAHLDIDNTHVSGRAVGVALQSYEDALRASESGVCRGRGFVVG